MRESSLNAFRQGEAASDRKTSKLELPTSSAPVRAEKSNLPTSVTDQRAFIKYLEFKRDDAARDLALRMFDGDDSNDPTPAEMVTLRTRLTEFSTYYENAKSFADRYLTPELFSSFPTVFPKTSTLVDQIKSVTAEKVADIWRRNFPTLAVGAPRRIEPILDALHQIEELEKMEEPITKVASREIGISEVQFQALLKMSGEEQGAALADLIRGKPEFRKDQYSWFERFRGKWERDVNAEIKRLSTVFSRAKADFSVLNSAQTPHLRKLQEVFDGILKDNDFAIGHEIVKEEYQAMIKKTAAPKSEPKPKAKGGAH